MMPLNEEMQLEESAAGNELVDEPLSEEVLMGRSFDDTSQPVAEEALITPVPAAVDKVETLPPTLETPAVAMAGPSSAALFEREESEHFRTRWSEIQGSFVDEPRAAVLQADALVTEVIEHLTTMFNSEHRSLEGQWNQGSDVSTEDLRKALQRYRSFFNRLVV